MNAIAAMRTTSKPENTNHYIVARTASLCTNMATDRNVNAFGTFLDTLLPDQQQSHLNEGDVAVQTEAPASPVEEQATPTAQSTQGNVEQTSGGTVLRPALVLLNILAPVNSMSASDLLKASGMDIQGFAAAVKALEDSKLISYTGDGADQAMQLTDVGRALLHPG